MADDRCTEELDATDYTAARLRPLEDSMRTSGFGKGCRAVIVNAANGLRTDAIRQLLVLLERVPPHVVWIFTTTNVGQESFFDDYDDAGPPLSRCVRIRAERVLAGQSAARTAGKTWADQSRAAR